jgi:predicted glutamine amidotransferase
MCRMLAIIAQRPVNNHYVLEFRQLARSGKVAKGRKPGHSDGWGIVAYDNGLPFYLARRPHDAYDDPEYEKACDALRERAMSGVVFAQLRKRSIGNKDIRNTPPLIQGSLCFMHNGTVHKLGNENESDSIKLIQMLSQKIAEGNPILGSLQKVYSRITTNYEYTSLTSVITNGESVLATKCIDPSQDAEYYDLMYARIRDSIIVSQEKTWQLDWHMIKNRDVAIINPGLEVSVERLF